MTWVKICGITNLEDARVAVEAGADALGFVFYDKSPRNIEPDVAHQIISALPEDVEQVGVFVEGLGLSPADVRGVGLTAIQMGMVLPAAALEDPVIGMRFTHFPKPVKLFLSLPMTYVLEDAKKIDDLTESFRHLRKRGPEQPEVPEGLFDAFFLDSGTRQQPGGTGHAFDWDKAVPVAEGMREGGLKLVVAGGLTPKNVTEAMGILKPWGVDVSSGVEARPGKKDPEKVRAFVAAVRQQDRAAGIPDQDHGNRNYSE
jgi:phosphoribosylanthranilate isomerase